MPALSSALPKNRTLVWTGNIDREGLDKIIEKLQKMLDKDSEGEVYLWLTNFGGTTSYSFAFYDLVRHVLGVELVTIGSGTVDSAAVTVFLAGVYRLVTPHTTFYLHEVSCYPGRSEPLSRFQRGSQLMDLKQAAYVRLLVEASGGKLDSMAVQEMLLRNTVLTAEEAVDLGLAHEIIHAPFQQRTLPEALQHSAA